MLSRLVLFALVLTACAPAITSTPLPALTREPTWTIAPTQTSTTPPTSTVAPTETLTPAPAIQVCSPLADYSLGQIPGLVTNPYHPPPPGSDNPHEGVDLSVLQPGTRVALAGAPVQAALAGTVAAAIQDRFPYGNALIIETPLDGLPADWPGLAVLPTPAPTLPFNGPLTCPDVDLHLALDPQQRSLYLVYAHLQAAPTLQAGDRVACAQPLGKIGASGNALNPHLHLEARVGPSGARFASLAHYDPGASPAEMATYCAWRVSNAFQLVDPLLIVK
ncbi:MAG TPA: M23 family metallopeptidase [Anaerolineaceae bacterium]|nr:M23 family metallopeptidase [Anaerolineaceae bacterium]